MIINDPLPTLHEIRPALSLQDVDDPNQSISQLFNTHGNKQMFQLS